MSQYRSAHQFREVLACPKCGARSFDYSRREVGYWAESFPHEALPTCVGGRPGATLTHRVRCLKCDFKWLELTLDDPRNRTAEPPEEVES